MIIFALWWLVGIALVISVGVYVFYRDKIIEITMGDLVGAFFISLLGPLLLITLGVKVMEYLYGLFRPKIESFMDKPVFQHGEKE